MSYYMGDYYRGDPGIGSFFGGLVKSAVGMIPGVGGVASKLLGKVMPGGSPKLFAGATSAIQKVSGAIVKHPVLSAAGAAGAVGAMGGALASHVATSMGGAGACPRGFHPGKSKHNRGSCVRNRRMNSCNPRALRRAARRLHSFARHYRKAVGFTSPHPKKGRMYFKARRKKA